MKKRKKPAQNRPTEKRNPNLRPFRKGVSGNPGGRPKEEKEVIAELRKYAHEWPPVLARMCRKGSIAALKLAFERAFGKAKQVVELTGADGGPVRFDARLLKHLPTADLETMRTMLERAEATAAGALKAAGANVRTSAQSKEGAEP